MGLFETIADRRIREARANGLFDNLPGKGKPIADLDTERPAGWWASRVVKTERDKARWEDLRAEITRLMPGLWRLDTEMELLAEVDKINQMITEYNRRTSYAIIDELDPQDTIGQWRSVAAFR